MTPLHRDSTASHRSASVPPAGAALSGPTARQESNRAPNSAAQTSVRTLSKMTATKKVCDRHLRKVFKRVLPSRGQVSIWRRVSNTTGRNGALSDTHSWKCDLHAPRYLTRRPKSTPRRQAVAGRHASRFKRGSSDPHILKMD